MENELVKRHLISKYGNESKAKETQEWKAHELIENRISEDEALYLLAKQECTETIEAMKSIRIEAMIKVEDPKERATIISLCARTQNEAFSKMQSAKEGLYDLKNRYKEALKDFEEKSGSDNLKNRSKGSGGMDSFWSNPTGKEAPKKTGRPKGKRKKATHTYSPEQFMNVPKPSDLI